MEKAEITIPVDNAQEEAAALASNVQYDETLLDDDDDVYSLDDDEGFDEQGCMHFSKNTALPKIYHLPQLYLEPKKKKCYFSPNRMYPAIFGTSTSSRCS